MADKCPLHNRQLELSGKRKTDKPVVTADGKQKKKKGGGGLTCTLLFAVAVIGMSPLQYGYAVGVVNAPEHVLREWYNQTHVERYHTAFTKTQIVTLWGLTVAIFCISGLFGGLFAGTLAQKFGRRGCLLQNNIVALAAAAFMGFAKIAKSYEMVIVGRFLIGFNSGVTTVAVPMYLSEISPVNLRGATGSVNQFGIVISILIAQILGLPQILGNARWWPLLFAMNAIPAALQIGLLYMIPESPRYLLISKNDEKGAKKVMFFSTSIFMQTGLSQHNATYATVGIGVINVLATMLSMSIIEKAGRRTLFLVGLLGMWAGTILLTIFLVLGSKGPKFKWASYLAVIIIIAYVVFCAIGPNVIAWFVSAELFTQSPRPKAMSISVVFNWFSNFIVGLLFPIFFVLLQNYVFLIFTVLITAFIFFTYKFLPETKDKEPEELMQLFMTEEDKNNECVTRKVFGKSPEQVKQENVKRKAKKERAKYKQVMGIEDETEESEEEKTKEDEPEGQENDLVADEDPNHAIDMHGNLDGEKNTVNERNQRLIN